MKEGVCNQFFVRHGQTRMTLDGRLQSHSDELPSVLTDEGRAQAAAVRGVLAPTRFIHIYSSPLLRAMETAAIIANRVGEIIPLPAVQERKFGLLENTSYKESSADRQAFLVNQDKPGYVNAHQIETDEELKKRMFPLLTNIALAHLGMNVLFVTHSGIMRFLIHHYGEIPYEEIKDLNIGEASYMHIRLFARKEEKRYEFVSSKGVTRNGQEVKKLF